MFIFIDEEPVLKATDVVASKDFALDEVLHQSFLSQDIVPRVSDDQLDEDFLDKMGSATDLPIESNVQMDVKVYRQTPTAEGSAGDMGQLIDVRTKTPSKMKGLQIIEEGRIDVPTREAEQQYLDALRSVSSSDLRKRLDKIRKRSGP
ncbi:hypothetical protein Dimus_039814 [Dionaea muscipula]